MSIEKFTRSFQEALSDAQSLALGKDHAYIEPAHVALTLLQQDTSRGLLTRAGVNIAALRKAAEDAVNRLPQVQGQEQVQASRDLVSVLQAMEKEAIKRGDQFIASAGRC